MHLIGVYLAWRPLRGSTLRWHGTRPRAGALRWLWLLAARRTPRRLTALAPHSLLLHLHLQGYLVVEYVGRDKHLRVLLLLYSLLVDRYVFLCVVHGVNHYVMAQLH